MTTYGGDLGYSATARRSLRRAKLVDRLATILMWAVSMFLVAVLFGIIATLLAAGLPMFSWRFLFTPGTFQAPGIGPQIFVSVYTLVLALAIVVPLGVSAAVYLSEYAKQNRFTSLVRFSTESLASVPSVVIGVFGAIVFLTLMHLGYSVLSGALSLALLNLPLMVRISEDAIRGVPNSYREASTALAATQWETVHRVVLPTALPGIITGMVLTGGRIIGETAPLVLTMGTSLSPNAYYSLNPLNTGETLAVHIWVLKIVGVPGVPNAQGVANGAAAVLLLIVLSINVGVAMLNRAVQRRLAGSGPAPRAGRAR